MSNTAQRRQASMVEMHHKHVAAEMAVRKIESSCATLDIQKSLLKEELDNAFMTGDVSDEDISHLKEKIHSVEERETIMKEELVHMKEISKETSPLAGAR